MKKIKNLKILLLSFIFSIPCVGFSEVILEPMYGSDRFTPVDMFHATCDNQLLNVTFLLENSSINGISAILNYDSNAIEILKILGKNETKNNLSYVVNDDKIVLNKLKTDGVGDDLKKVTYSIYFKSKLGVTQTSFELAEGSYLIDGNGNMVNVTGKFDASFQEVPECDPDEKQPVVKLMFPSEDRRTALDTYFQFNILDEGKGVNKEDITISINGNTYNIKEMEHEWDESVLTVYPDFWMPFNTGIELIITVFDKQVYGGANVTTQEFHLETPDEVYFLNNIDPLKYREITNGLLNNKGDESSCKFLSQAYLKAISDNNLEQKSIIFDINKKLDCPDIDGDIVELVDLQENFDFSVFAVLGWGLFSASLLIGLLLIILRRVKK